MPRPVKCRKVCRMPGTQEFVPAGAFPALEKVILSVDEYETIRLVDYEGFSQEQCGEYMGVGRTTVQQVYASARSKVARALVEGRALKIEGGHYRLCDGKEKHCTCGGCKKHKAACHEKEKWI